jgi:transaldolase
VKIPVTNTWGASTASVLRRLSCAGVKLNVTAVLTLEQVERVAVNLDSNTSSIISIFAGRIADTGIDPIPILRRAARVVESSSNIELLWASPRELFNIFQADDSGCDIITLPPEILGKLDLVGRDLNAYSLETVGMFYQDACAAGYQIQTQVPMIPEPTLSQQIARHL